MRSLFAAAALAAFLLAPARAHAADAAVAPATTEDLDAFDKVLESQHGKGTPPAPNGIGREISKEAHTLREQTAKGGLHLSVSRRRGQQNQTPGSRGDGVGTPDSASTRDTVGGKRSGKEDNPGKGDSGKPTNGNNGNGNGNGNGHGNGH